jgi:hypothetical protein
MTGLAVAEKVGFIRLYFLLSSSPAAGCLSD